MNSAGGQADRPELADRAWIGELVAMLDAAGDAERAVGQQRYMKSAMPYHGLKTPDLRRLIRPLIGRAMATWDRPTLEATVRVLWDEATHREQRYAAIAVTGGRVFRPWQDLAMLPLYEHMIVTGAWWDVVDDIAAHRVGPLVGAVGAVGAEGRATMRSWSTISDVPGAMWLRRTAIIHQLGFRAATDTDVLGATITANLCGSLFGNEFFIRKAIGWALRQYAYHDAAWVVAFVAAHEDRLAPLSRREALKHLGR